MSNEQQQQSSPTLVEYISKQLLCNPFASDVVFKISPPTHYVTSFVQPEGHQTPRTRSLGQVQVVQTTIEMIPAHRIILARSPVFKKMFFDSKMQESQQKQQIPEEISKKSFMEFLQFMYTDACNLTGMA